MNKRLLVTLSGHTEEVTSMALTSDSAQSILFSGSYDKRVIAWHTSRYIKLFEIACTHPLYTLKLTHDNEFLVALDKKGSISTLQLEENLDSVRLNLPREVYENVDMNITNNNKFMIFPLQDDNLIEVWNVESKVLAYKIQDLMIDRICLITSPDSKYLFYTSKINEISQMDIEKHKVMAKYRGTHNLNINALSVSPDGKRLVSAGEDGKFCMYLTPKFNEGDKEKLIENYNELPVHDN